MPYRPLVRDLELLGVEAWVAGSVEGLIHAAKSVLEFVPAVALVLKLLWEREKEQSTGSPPFAPPDPDSIHSVFERAWGWATQAGFEDPIAFNVLVHHMLLAGLHQVGIDSVELDQFTASEAHRVRIQREDASPGERGEHVALRGWWVCLCLEVTEMTVRRREVLLHKEETKREFRCEFGAQEIRLLRQTHLVRRLEEMLHLKTSHPESTAATLTQAVREADEERERECANLRYELATVPHLARLLDRDILDPGATAATIKGETISEQIAWLRREIPRVEERLRGAKVEFLRAVNGLDGAQNAVVSVARMREIVDDTENRARHHRELESEIERARRKADQLGTELGALFREGAGPDVAGTIRPNSDV